MLNLTHLQYDYTYTYQIHNIKSKLELCSCSIEKSERAEKESSERRIRNEEMVSRQKTGHIPSTFLII